MKLCLSNALLYWFLISVMAKQKRCCVVYVHGEEWAQPVKRTSLTNSDDFFVRTISGSVEAQYLHKLNFNLRNLR